MAPLLAVRTSTRGGSTTQDADILAIDDEDLPIIPIYEDEDDDLTHERPKKVKTDGLSYCTSVRRHDEETGPRPRFPTFGEDINIV